MKRASAASMPCRRTAPGTPEKNCREFIKQYFDLTRQPKLSRALEKSRNAECRPLRRRNRRLRPAVGDGPLKERVQGLPGGGRGLHEHDVERAGAEENADGRGPHRQTAEAIRAIEKSDIPVGAAGLKKGRLSRTSRRTKWPRSSSTMMTSRWKGWPIQKGTKKDPDRTVEPLRRSPRDPRLLSSCRTGGWAEEALHLPTQAHFLEAAVSYPEPIKKLAVVFRDAKVSQVVLGGIEENTIVKGPSRSLLRTDSRFTSWKTSSSRDGGTAEEGAFDNLYRAGAVPCSFKMFIYDATEGIQAVIKKRWREMFRAKLAKKEIIWVDELPFVKDSQ